MPQARKAARRATARKRPAARKRAARKPAARKPAARKRAAGEPELPARLRDFSKDVRSQLLKIERQIVSAQASYRRRAARLLRETSVELGKLESRGETEWRRLNQRARRDATNLLKRLERQVGPAKGGKKRSGAAKVARQATRKAQHALRKAAAGVAPRRKKAKRK